MDPKVILYIILGIAYFLYTMHKKSQENKEKTARHEKNEEEYDTPTPPSARPVSPPVESSIDEILRQIKREQQEAEAKKRQQVPVPKPMVAQQPRKQTKAFIKEKKKGVFEEGNYERDLTDEEKIERGNLKIQNEGVYKIKSLEEEQVEEAASAYEFNARNAIIGSIIFERKF